MVLRVETREAGKGGYEETCISLWSEGSLVMRHAEKCCNMFLYFGNTRMERERGRSNDRG